MKRARMVAALIALVMVSHTLRAASSLSDAVAYWKLDEATGTRADATGNGHDLSASGAPGSASGQIGNALSLSGAATDHLFAADAPAVSPSGSFTYALWVYFTTKTKNHHLLNHGVFAPNAGYALRRYHAADKLQWGVSADGASTVIAELAAPPVGEWHLVIVGCDSAANEISIQLDDGAPVTAPHTGCAFDSAMDLKLGINQTGSTGTLDGRIDEAGLWHRALSGAERAELWNGGSGITWPF